uniref:Nucleoside-diphosphate kinase n=1 Tax=Octactis speculum TaxID=3111310 RepID=A0A7S2CUN0_9STRA|mmetsp:Transcript_39824/g.54226  ORF Transcript_39824/g.54226 Transcript_39824/m.54226 type:complete len:373 (+) Transcript_39824:59-1177(+)|eukprot:CAMPEP_0185768872 /NCGR_PEP_ID=MMETSP1174-20130828/52741_1 /TAXON_ID=35687 /ORGANISM="Dictyocha speculum, Strain CCMP1381" /LENGTH=372 /DNA_ID=CAMNT_0028453761 /DNA_START=55 /DNA_END=1173 /DNA_ORIENTATION=+
MADEIAATIEGVAGSWDWSSGVSFNTALVFIKPHAINEKVKEMVSNALKAREVQILYEQSLGAEEIEKGEIIDNHYSIIAQNAMNVDPRNLKVADDKLAEFETTFETSWAAALQSGTVMNASQSMSTLAQNGKGLAAVEEEALIKFKLGPGCYVSKCCYAMRENDVGDVVGVPVEEGEDDASQLYIINGFYGLMREKFIAKDASVYVYVVGFTSDKLNWATFRNDVIGPTDPAKASETSIRGKIYKEWERLGLKQVPSVGDNGVHASAGPLEGLKERMVWLQLALEQDPMGAKLIEVIWNYNTTGFITKLMDNEAVQFCSEEQPIFDLTEGMDSLEVLCIANNLAYATPEEINDFYGEDKAEEDENGDEKDE